MIDSDGDGFISRQDVKTMLVNLGQNGDDSTVDRYMKSALKEGASGSERINFTQFLTMFGEHLSEVRGRRGREEVDVQLIWKPRSWTRGQTWWLLLSALTNTTRERLTPVSLGTGSARSATA